MKSPLLLATTFGLTIRSRGVCNAFLAQTTHLVTQTKVPILRSSTMSSCGYAPNMARNRGLEFREEGATPLPGGMTLYIKPAADGKSVGDCPFAHFVRMVLAEKNLDYDLKPTPPDAKPQWLVDEYGGKMPALRHRKECYVESSVIAQYLDFFFQEPALTVDQKKDTDAASDAMEGFFPALAKFNKHRPNGDEEDLALLAGLEQKLLSLEDHLSGSDRTGPYLVGSGEKLTLLDCSIAPQLYIMDVCLEKLKDGPIDLAGKYPNLRKYMDALFERPSFKNTVEYGPETVVWGWTSHL